MTIIARESNRHCFKRRLPKPHKDPLKTVLDPHKHGRSEVFEVFDINGGLVYTGIILDSATIVPEYPMKPTPLSGISSILIRLFRIFGNLKPLFASCWIGIFILPIYSNVEAQESTIDFGALEQKISGFGGVNMPDWIDNMTGDQLNTAFGNGEGQLGLSILRIKVPMYREDWEQVVPAALQARNLGAIVLASPWSPPSYMKSNQSEIGGYLLPEYYGDFATHLADFYQFMLSRGVELYAISLQNEPDVHVGYESCDWTSDQFRAFLKGYGAIIPTRVVVAESFNFTRGVTDPILNDPEAAAQVDIVGGHLYGGGLYSYPLAMNKGKEVWMTEHLDLGEYWRDSLATGKEIHDCMVSNFNAYIWWYIRRFYGLIDDNSDVTKRGYVVSHFSRFIRPGYYRVDADGSPVTGVSVSAYRDFDTAVIVAINQTSQNQVITFSMSGGEVASFDRYETTATENVSYLGSIQAGGTFQLTLPANSITTLDGGLNATSEYTNPILPGDHPDLTLLKHGDDFYLSGSSFHFTPYGEILHSRDLVHWETISRVVPPTWPELISDAPAAGTWQGVITYFYNSFWYYFSNSSWGGQYFCKADSPRGPWSAPVKMNTTDTTGTSGYDNSIFVDDDGTPYMLIKAGQYVNRIQQIGLDGHLISEAINMDWLNVGAQFSWAEGPVMCKRNGWYYYFFAGNVFGGQWALRSQTLTDPSSWEFMGSFFAPVTDTQTGFRGPNHITAPVQLADGTWWTISHSYENNGADDWNGLGRQGLLHQVIWNEAGKPTGMAPTTLPVAAPSLLGGNIPLKTTVSDDFNESILKPEWYFLNAASSAMYSLSANPGQIRLTPGYGKCHLLQREEEHSYVIVTSLALGASSADQEGGIYVTNGDESLQAKLYSGYNAGKVIGFSFNTTSYQVPNPVGDMLWLKLVRENHTLTGYYSADGVTWTQVGQAINVALLDGTQANYNSWVGNSHGLYAQGNYVDFDYFYYNESSERGSGIWLEAECGQTGSLWDIVEDATASHGQYVSAHPGNNAYLWPADPETHITYPLTIGEAGNYNLWLRVICPTGNDDSFWVKIDENEPVQWNDLVSPAQWTWKAYPYPFILSAGEHTLTIAYREDGALLDKLFITASDQTPTGTGGNASNCGE